jgi:hypothetical protein
MVRSLRLLSFVFLMSTFLIHPVRTVAIGCNREFDGVGFDPNGATNAENNCWATNCDDVCIVNEHISTCEGQLTGQLQGCDAAVPSGGGYTSHGYCQCGY